jgi:hypothetical protein
MVGSAGAFFSGMDVHWTKVIKSLADLMHWLEVMLHLYPSGQQCFLSSQQVAFFRGQHPNTPPISQQVLSPEQTDPSLQVVLESEVEGCSLTGCFLAMVVNTTS